MPESPTKPFNGIFVSYRRDDSSGHAGRLFDRLIAHFGPDRIFMDIDDIEPGEDFVTVIENAVSSCEILIAVIGRNWLGGTSGATGRLDNPNDFVHLEIATALSRDIRVIPVLVKQATMPKPDDLPDALAKFARRNAVELRDIRWQDDVDQLINVMDRILAGSQTNPDLIIPTPDSSTPALLSGNPETPDLCAVKPQPWHSSKRTIPIVVITIFMIVAAIMIVAIIGISVIWVMKRPAEEQQTAKRKAVLQPDQATSAPPVTELRSPPGMVYVPGGKFMMGRNKSDGGGEYERPAHEVTVKPFFIDLHEVTREEYKKFLDANPDQVAPAEWVNRNYPDGSARKPVTSVDWDRANAFAAWSSKRLPTEEEWEFAARATDGRLYPWGNVWEARLANVHTKDLTEAGKFPGLSPYGAVDMVGNAWEWTTSPLTPYPNGTLSEQPAPDSKVIRGGSYIDSPNQATTTYRVGYPARSATDYSKIGFRCVSDATHRSKPR